MGKNLAILVNVFAIKMESLEDIEDKYNLSLEKETKKFNDSLSNIKSLSERKKIEKNFKKKIQSFLENYDSEVSVFIKKRGAFSSQKTPSPKKKIFPSLPYKSHHLDLTTSNFDKGKRTFLFFIFKLKLKFNKFFKFLLPSVFIRFFYRIKFSFFSIKGDFFRFFRVSYSSFKNILSKFWSKIKSFWRSFFNSLNRNYYSIFPKKEEDSGKALLKENRERIQKKI